MTFRKLKEISRPHYYCLSLDRFFPRMIRSILRKGSALAALVSFALSFDILPLSFGKADGLFFIFIFIYLALSFVEFFYRSMMNEGLLVRIREKLLGKNENLDYALSSILYVTDEIDVTRAFFETKVGLQIFLRLGIFLENCKNFVYAERSFVMSSSINLEGDSIDLSSYAIALYDSDKSLQSFLSQNSINKEEFEGSATWVMKMEEQKHRKERFWGRENLGVIPSIGTSWSYGIATDLGKFGVSFENSVNISLFDIENGYRDKEVQLLENILERGSEANVIIIDDDEGVVRDIVGRLLKKIKLGTSLPSLDHKNIVELDWNALVAFHKNKNELETEILKIFNQAISAGNIILYIRDLSGFVSSTKVMGINLSSLISSHISSNSLQVVASATNSDFHFFIETNPTLLEKFERIIPDLAGVEVSVGVLLEQALFIEKQYGIVFSYPAILALAKSADQFITYGEMPGKALDILVEIAPWAAEHSMYILKENDVSIFVSEKTGITTGVIKEKEAEKIEHLEELLHKRVVGQNEAINGIASAVRRARSGVGNPKRPISSFLFIGPTGVGKTEVSKSLTESFFGDEKKMVRFDMSEYSSPEALSQLIGDFVMNKSGLLASKIRDNPYGVLLLDEFEKAAPDVLDLFLQILDEGVFTDALGRQVNCRNLIIIATSNAGSDMIWETIRSGSNLIKSKDTIINSIIKDKIFRSELINRFDGVIFFHPLQNNELESVARLGLEKLARRLKEKNIELVINQDIINFLVEKGSDPQFGGRSINRAIQNEIEDLIARKIVSGKAKPGSKIEIKREELN
ncbi:MAG: AAA family ATPase [Patescibacteria group bacterium]